jgi:predicted nucleic-acid-binding Zn-ribbon protein
MFYNDGVDIDENERVILCPKCGNEEFSGKAEFIPEQNNNDIDFDIPEDNFEMPF